MIKSYSSFAEKQGEKTQFFNLKPKPGAVSSPSEQLRA
jgi:hypothetical protein